MKQLIAIIIFSLFASNSSWALDLTVAKQTGLVGERNDGYLGYVVKPANSETQALVKSVNTQRKAKFNDSAEKNQLTTQQVAQRFHQLAIKKTAGGNYYQDNNGHWIKK